MIFNPILIIKALFRKVHLIILFPIVVVGVVYYLTKDNPKEYQSGMMFYTGLVSGSNISSQGEGRTDNLAVNNAFDNLMTIIESREVIEDVALKLLAKHLTVEVPDPAIISESNHLHLHNQVLSQSLIEELTKYNNYDSTHIQLKFLYYQGESTELIKLLNASSTFYSIDQIRKNLTVKRQGNSDMIQVLYKSSDPGICYLTLKILAETFIDKNQAIRKNETSGILDYFVEELGKARNNLNKAEEELKDYSQSNQVINYSEQTKYIAAAKEDLEKNINSEKATVDAHMQAISNLEKSLEAHQLRFLNNTNILDKRTEIVEINTQISKIEISSGVNDSERIKELREQANLLEEEMIQLTREYNRLNHSTESVPRQNILNQWLVNVLELDKSKARLEVLESQRQYFISLFSEFAPIGFNLSKMEREINIAEREYLSILHGLNLAKLRQSNLELFNTLDLLDEPFFPLNPRASKAKLVLIGAFLASLFFVSAIIIGIDMLDRSLRTPSLAEIHTGLEPLGAATKELKSKSIFKEVLYENLFNLTINKLSFFLNNINSKTKPIVLVFSTRDQLEIDKSGLMVARAMHAIYKDVNYMHPVMENDDNSNQENKEEKINFITYNKEENGFHKNIELIDKSEKASVIQLPGFDKQSLAGFLKLKPTLNILIVSAQQTWDYHDKKLLESFMANYPDAIFKVFINNVQPYHLEDFLAEIPRKRSFIRIWIKKLLKLNF